MKKTYINPELEVIKIATMQILADSEHVEIDDDTPIEPGDVGMPGIGDMFSF